MMLHNTEKTKSCHRNVPQVLFVARTTMAKYLTEAGFVSLLHKFVFIVSLVDWCALFLVRKGIFDWKHALEHL